MPEVLIIADDLTGANDTAVMIAQQGLRTCTVLNEKSIGEDILKSCGCISYSTDSRGLSEEEAYKRVYDAARRFGTCDTMLYSKRIDSTLRGNLGAETDAMRDAVGGDPMAVIVPAFPGAGRSYVGGHLMVYGVPLYRTAAASDPKNPVNTAGALGLYQKQSKYETAEIFLEELSRGEESAAEKLRELYKKGIRNVIFDAAEDEDLEIIARAVLQSGIPFIAVDPGVSTAHIAAEMRREQKGSRGKLLFAVGSINDVAVRQTNKLLKQPGVSKVVLDTARLLQSEPERESEIERASAAASELSTSSDVCCICVAGIFPESRVELEPYAKRDNVSCDEISARINNALARVAVNVLSGNSDYKGLFACGGDVAVSICSALDAYGVFPLSDVVPLAVYGLLAGGEFDGMHLITKGGMIGNDDTMTDCVSYLQNIIKE